MERGEEVPRRVEKNRVRPARMDNSSSSSCLIFQRPLLSQDMGDGSDCPIASAWRAFSFNFVRTGCKHHMLVKCQSLDTREAAVPRLSPLECYERMPSKRERKLALAQP